MREAAKGRRVYPRLVELFKEADARYNSGVFHFEDERGRPSTPDTVTPGLDIPDRIIKPLINGLYYPESPYAFDVLPADLLGQVYERFLGKVIRLKGRTAVVEEKPEVRKAGGVYYTPTYIVDYIVRQTLGPLLDGRTLKTAKGLSILDPACGSGSFLLGALDFLLDWYVEKYTSDNPEKHAKGKTPRLVPGPGGDWRLTVGEKKRILLDHIFGVDIDPQAVEVTKLSLLLRLLEGETAQTVDAQYKLLRERILPELAGNIKCGNSLVGPDFYDSHGADAFTDEDHYRINAFDWLAEFSDIMRRGGFDAVIGNPPYVRIQTMTQWAGPEVAYIKANYRAAAKGNFDLYVVFVEKGLRLLGEVGRLGYIVPHRFFKNKYGEALRSILSTDYGVESIIDFDGFMVFDGPSINTCLLFVTCEPTAVTSYARARFTKARPDEVASMLLQTTHGETIEVMSNGTVDQAELCPEGWTFVWKHETRLWDKMSSIGSRLADVTDKIYQGLKTGADPVFICEEIEVVGKLIRVRSSLSEEVQMVERSIVEPLIKGGQMSRYVIGSTDRVIIFPYRSGVLIGDPEMAERYPQAFSYLTAHRNLLERRDGGKMKGPHWYGYSRSQALDVMWKPKIMTPDYYAHASFSFDNEGAYYFPGGGAGGYGILARNEIDPIYLLGLLNARLLDWYLRKVSIRAYQTAFMYTKQYIAQLPIQPIDFNNPEDAAHHKKMVALVTQMLDLHKRLPQSASEHERTLVERRIRTTDNQIDALVYELYGLTDDEIAIVEQAAN